MSASDLPHVPPIRAINLQMIQNIAAEEVIEQIASERDLQSWMDEAFNPIAMMRNFRTLDEQKREHVRRQEKTSDATETPILRVEEVTEIAEKFQQKN